MKNFFQYRWKSQRGQLLLLLLITLGMGVGAAALFVPPGEGVKGGLEQVRLQAPALANLLNMRLFILPGDHLVSLLFGLLLPLSSLWYVISAAARLQARPLYTGEIIWLVNAPRAKGLVVLTHYAIILLGVLAQYALLAFSAWAGRFLFPAWRVDMLPLLRVCLGAFLMMGLPAGAAVLAAALSRDGRMPRLVPVLMLLFFILRMAANLGGNAAWLQYLTPFTLFDVWGVLRGQPGSMLLTLVPFAAGGLLAVLGAAIFARRDLS